jgi:hypothetical protein
VACEGGHVKVVTLLLDAGAELETYSQVSLVDHHLSILFRRMVVLA